MVIRIYRDRQFELLDDVYDPGEDSFMLVDAAIGEVRKGDSILEIGTGSGIVSLFLKDIANVIAVDISPYACKNARLNGLDVIRTNMFSGICGRFDIVIFNPPYLPTSAEEKLKTWLNEAFDGGPTGRKAIDPFIDRVGYFLKPGGKVLMVISSITDIDAVSEKFVSAGFKVERIGCRKICFESLVVLKATLSPALQ
jgi:release factor glutamine methyltransferase